MKKKNGGFPKGFPINQSKNRKMDTDIPLQMWSM